MSFSFVMRITVLYCRRRLSSHFGDVFTGAHCPKVPQQTERTQPAASIKTGRKNKTTRNLQWMIQLQMKADDQHCMCGIFFVFAISFGLAEPFAAADNRWIFMLRLVQRVVPDRRNVLCWRWRRRLRHEGWRAVGLRNIHLGLGIV